MSVCLIPPPPPPPPPPTQAAIMVTLIRFPPVSTTLHAELRECVCVRVCVRTHVLLLNSRKPSLDRHAEITVITPDSGATWRGSQMSFHLRRMLKGDRLHPSRQADEWWGVVGWDWAGGVSGESGDGGDARTETHVSQKKKANDFGGMTDSPRNERLMARNGCWCWDQAWALRQDWLLCDSPG